MEPCLLYRVYEYCVKTWPDRYLEPAKDVVGLNEESNEVYLAAPWEWCHYFECESDWVTALEALVQPDDDESKICK